MNLIDIIQVKTKNRMTITKEIRAHFGIAKGERLALLERDGYLTIVKLRDILRDDIEVLSPEVMRSIRKRM